MESLTEQVHLKLTGVFVVVLFVFPCFLCVFVLKRKFEVTKCYLIEVVASERVCGERLVAVSALPAAGLAPGWGLLRSMAQGAGRSQGTSRQGAGRGGAESIG